MHIQGTHNVANALCMFSLRWSDWPTTSVDVETLKTFKGLEHLRFVKELHGVRYYNDFKGTQYWRNLRNLIWFRGFHLAQAKEVVIILADRAKVKTFSQSQWINSANTSKRVLIGEDRSMIEKAIEGTTELLHAESPNKQ